MGKCEDCEHCFKPKTIRLTIRDVRDRLLACTSQSVWVVHNGWRYRLYHFGKVNHVWVGWCYGSIKPLSLTNIHNALDTSSNWDRLDNYSLAIHLGGDSTAWVHVFRIEEKLAFPAKQMGIALEDIEAEILIHVHSEVDTFQTYAESQQ